MAKKTMTNSVDLEQMKEEYKKLLNDSNFEKLEAELRKPNIFNILGIGRMEIRHSNFLAWLLDPNESHGLDNRFLIRVLRDLALEKKNELDIFKINDLNFSNVEVNREVPINLEDKNCRIDILIIFRDEADKLVICIENKIDTTDSDGQLTEYKEYIEGTFKEDDGYKNVFVYLTPNGTNPNNVDESEKWSNYSYAEIKKVSGIIKHLENIQSSLTDSTIKTYISDYLITLKREIMGTNDDATKIANDIYTKNIDIFKFVFENKSNELYKLTWKEEYPWVEKFAEKMLQLIREIDKENEFELIYTQRTISIKKRSGNNCYTFYHRADPGCCIEFPFSTSEKEQPKIIDSIDKYLSENVKPTKNKLNWKKNTLPFSINFVNELSEEDIKEIHKIRFGLNQ